MKKTILTTIIVTCLLISVSSCKKAKLTKELWYIESAKDLEDGSDITSDYLGEIWEFSKDGNYLENNQLKGAWEFSKDKETLIITNTDNSLDSYRIKKLAKKEMILEELGEEELTLKRYEN